jgi:hypothetical protein
MAKSKSGIGSWAFLLGIVIAILAGLFGDFGTGAVLPAILLILGLVVGALNINLKEANTFLLTSTVLIIVSSFGISAFSMAPKIAATLNSVLMFLVPAIIVVAIKSIAETAKQ